MFSFVGHLAASKKRRLPNNHGLIAGLIAAQLIAAKDGNQVSPLVTDVKVTSIIKGSSEELGRPPRDLKLLPLPQRYFFLSLH